MSRRRSGAPRSSSKSRQTSYSSALQGFNEDNQTLIQEWRISTDESVKLVREELDRRIEELRLFMQSINDKVLKRAELEKLEEFKKSVLTRFDVDALKVKDLVKKVEPYERRFDAIANDVDGKHKDTVIRLNALEARLENDLKEIELRLSKSGGNQFAGDGDLMGFLKKQFQCDAHQPFSEGSQVMDRLLKLEEETVKINNSHVKMMALMSSLQADVANKIDLATFSTQIGKKIDRDEMLDLIKTFQADEEKNRKMQQDILKLKKKLKETIDFVEDKIKELKKEFDIGYINKVLKAKAEDKDVRGQFKSMNDTMSEQKQLFDALKKDLENLILAYKKLSQFISLLQDEDANTLASSKQLCLSCGRGSKFAPEHKQVAQSD